MLSYRFYFFKALNEVLDVDLLIITFSVPPLTSDQPSSWRLLPGGGAAEREETLGGVWHHLL